MNFQVKRQQKEPFEQPSEHIPANDNRHDRVMPDHGRSKAARQAHRPGHIPEWRVDEVKAVVQHMAHST